MARDDDRKRDDSDLGDFALDLDDDVLAEALAAVERRVEEGKRGSAPPPPTPEELDEVEGDIELAFDDDFDLGPVTPEEAALGAPREPVEDPPTADSVAGDSRLNQLQRINEALLQQNEDLIDEVHELKDELEKAKRRSEASEERAKDSLRKASMLVLKMRQRDEKLEVLRGRLSDARAQLRDWEPLLGELREQLRDAESERERLKARHGREVDEVRNFGSEKVFKSLLPVLDHFDLVMQHAGSDPEKLAEGVGMTVRQLFGTLQRQGLARVETAVGQAFDPERHEAISRVESDEHPDGAIVEVFQEGYQLNGRLLRAARTAVASATAEPAPRFDDAEAGPPGEE